MKQAVSIFFGILFLVGGVKAQSVGNGFPNIENYSSQDYDGHIQNWGFAEDSNGVLYLSNLQSIKIFDGANWKNINIPNGRTYSVHKGENEIIYVGGVDEFGYLYNSPGLQVLNTEYHSLRHLVPDSVKLERFFDIVSVEDTVYFQTNNALIRYDGKRSRVFYPDIRFSGIFKNEGKVYVREAEEGLMHVRSDTLISAFSDDYFSNHTLFGFLKTSQGDLYCSYFECTRFNGTNFEPVNMEVNRYLETNYMDEAIVLQDGTLAFATRAGGVVHTDVNGNILNVFNEENGLINNTVYGIYEDINGSVWAATIRGISRIDLTLPLRFFDHRNGIDEGINDIGLYRNNLVLGSSTGLYKIDESKQLQKYQVNESCSQLGIIQENLYASCGEQLLLYDSGNYLNISGLQAYRFKNYIDPNTVVFISDSEISIAELDGLGYEILYEIENISVIPVSIEIDEEQNIWIAHRLGVYKISLDWEDGEIIGHTAKEYLTDLKNPSDDKRVDVTWINGQLAFLTWGKGILNYDDENDRMVQNTRLGNFFSDTTRQYFFAEEDRDGNIWFRSESEYQAALKQEDGSYQLYEGPLKLVDHQQSNVIYTIDDEHVWYGTDQGLVRYTKEHNFDHKTPFYTQINEVLVRNDSLISNNSQNKFPVLKFQDNELRFTYAAASYFAPEETQYRAKLEGFDQDWTIWTHETQKDYTNIPEGDYSFKIQARNAFGVMSESAGFSFSVLPPWYRTWWAYLLYAISISGILYGVYKIRINQILKVQRIRNNIASDLHDEVSATLSSISYFAQAIESEKVKGDKGRFLKLISNSAGDAKEKITDIVWAINPEHDNWTGFLSKCRRYASDLLESKDISYSLKIDEYIPGKLDMQLRQHLWLIYKEMITNAARHSEANNVDVIMKYEDGFLKLVVQDDGKGMDVDGVRKGNGLVNINKRADQIGGEINLKTSEGFGTRWRLKVRV